MSKVIYFGDCNIELAEQAKAHRRDAFLVESSNYQEFLESRRHNLVCYTSLADLPKDISIVMEILLSADTIVYCPPEVWSDHKTITATNATDCIQGSSEILLLYLSDQVKVVNLNLCISQKYKNSIADTRKTNSKQIWIAGCSVSHGVGVKPTERYGSLVGDKLDLPCSFLTAPGSSIRWAANQILKSDIRSGDILCWGITTFRRIPYYYQDQLHHLHALNALYQKNSAFNRIFPIDQLDDENNLFQCLESIRELINFCKKLDIQLVMFNAVIDDLLNRSLLNEQYYYQFKYLLNKNAKTYNTQGLFLYQDFGTDNLHPGPKTHQLYSNFLAKIITSTAV